MVARIRFHLVRQSGVANKERMRIAISILMEVAALQALVLAAMLYLKGRPANKILAVWLCITALDMGSAILYALDLYKEHPHWIGLRYGMYYAYGPFLFYYVRSLTGKSFRWPDLWHLLPLLLLKLYQIPFFLQSGPEKLEFLAGYFKRQHIDFVLIDLCFSGSGPVYVGLCFWQLVQHRRRIQEQFSYHDRIDLQWLKLALIIQLIIWLVVIAVYIPTLFGIKVELARYIYAFVALWIFIVGYAGFLQPQIFSTQPPAEQKLPMQNLETIIRQLEAYMETEAWREGKLSIQDISNAIQIPIHRLSRAINQHYQLNFFNFVNAYRVQAARQLLSDPAYQQYSILDIAYSVGFNSKSSFNAVFKEHTGSTPSTYRKKNFQQTPAGV